MLAAGMPMLFMSIFHIFGTQREFVARRCAPRTAMTTSTDGALRGRASLPCMLNFLVSLAPLTPSRLPQEKSNEIRRNPRKIPEIL
jgi:hypothetical protein